MDNVPPTDKITKPNDQAGGAKPADHALFSMDMLGPVPTQKPDKVTAENPLPSVALTNESPAQSESTSAKIGNWFRGAASTVGAVGQGAYESAASGYHTVVNAGESVLNATTGVYEHRAQIATEIGHGLQAAADYPSQFMQHPSESIRTAAHLASTVAGDVGSAAVTAGSAAIEATKSAGKWVGNHKLETTEMVAAAAVEVLSVGTATPVLATIGAIGAAGTIHGIYSVADNLQAHSADIGVLADPNASQTEHDKAFTEIAKTTGGDALGLAGAAAGVGISKLLSGLTAAAPAAEIADTPKSVAKGLEGTTEAATRSAASAENAEIAARSTKPADLTKPAESAETAAPATDASGRPMADGNAERVALTHPPLSAQELQVQRAAVESDLAAHNGADGKTILDQFNASNLSDDQKNRVLNVLAETRSSYLAPGKDGSVPAEQLNSYRHTLGELKAGIESSKTNGLTPRETQDALLAGMLSDSHKSGWSASTGGNFFTHHLDGALAADTVLSRQLGDGFDTNDLAAVKRAILEHQITPPTFMADAYTNELRAGMRAAKVVPTAEDEKAIANIRQAMANPLTSPTEPDGNGGYRLAFSPKERDLLRQYVGEGTQNWHVPAPANADVPNLAPDLNAGKIGTVTRTADIDDNYNAETNSQGEAIRGPFKIAGLRGPRNTPPDLTIDDATEALRDNMRQNKQFLTDADKARLASPEHEAQVDSVYAQAKERVADWLTKRDGHPPDSNTPYWGKPIQPPPPGASFQEMQAWRSSDEAKEADAIQQRFAQELYEMRKAN